MRMSHENGPLGVMSITIGIVLLFVATIALDNEKSFVVVGGIILVSVMLVALGVIKPLRQRLSEQWK